MEVQIDLDAITVRLVNADDLDTFRVRAMGGETMSPHDREHRLADVIDATHTGRWHLGAGVFIDPTAVAFLASGSVDDDWQTRFDAMCTSAKPKGWIADDGAIEAHVVFDPPLT